MTLTPQGPLLGEKAQIKNDPGSFFLISLLGSKSEELEMLDLLGFLLSHPGGRRRVVTRHCSSGLVRFNLDNKEPFLDVMRCWNESLDQPLKDISLLLPHRPYNDLRTHLFAKVQGDNMAVLLTDDNYLISKTILGRTKTGISSSEGFFK